MPDDTRVDADDDADPDRTRGEDAAEPADGDGPAGDADPGSQWRFALDEVGPEAEAEREAARDPPIEPESVDAENALFVVAGVLGTLLLVFSVTL